MDVYGSIWGIYCTFWKDIETCLSFQWDTQNLWLFGHVLGGRWWSSYQLIIDVCGWRSNGCGPEDNFVCVCVCVCVCSVASVVSDSVTLWTVAHQAPLSMEFSWQEYWSGSSTRRVGWRGRLEGAGGGRGSKREGTYVYLWSIHVDVRQKPSQYCKVIIIQLNIKYKSLKKNTGEVGRSLFQGIFPAQMWDWTHISGITGNFFTAEPLGKP